MKIEVWTNKSDTEPVRLRLVPGDGSVTIQAVDVNGDRLSAGTLMEISADGVSLFPGLNAGLGFPLDEDGRLKVAE